MVYVKLKLRLQYLDYKEVHLRIQEPQGLQRDTTSKDEMIVKLQPYVPGTIIYYTLDGSDPATHSALYKELVCINLKTKPTVRLNIIQVTPPGNTSVLYRADYVRDK